MIKVSVIVPVYKTEKYLRKCLDSLVNQTLKEIEIIAINDGSPDNSLEILKEYKKKYPNFKYIDKENEGVAIARNTGIKEASGEYIGFIDSDDYASLNQYEELYNKAVLEDSDVVLSGYYMEEENGRTSSQQLDDENYYGCSLKENPEILKITNPFITSKIFRKSFLEKNNILMEKYRIFEDLLFCYKSYLLANKISKVNLPLYHYIRRDNVSVTGSFTEKFYDIIPVMTELKRFYKEHLNKEEFEEFKDPLCQVAIHHTYLRYIKRVGIKKVIKKYRYMKDTMKFLDSFDSTWRNSEYFKRKKLSKYPYTSPLFFIVSPLGNKYADSFKRGVRFGAAHILGSTYKTLSKRKINEKSVFFDTQHGNDLNGNMFYIMKELRKDSKYNDYIFYISCNKNRIKEFQTKLNFYKITSYKLVSEKTYPYLKALATSKYLFSDTSLPTYYRKRKEQIYFNTWHGTPLKTLGRSVKYDFYNISNVLKNFTIADYVLYPNIFMKDIMIKDYMLYLNNNNIYLGGYPRNGIFKEESSLKTKKQRIAYMPTWRGTLNAKDTHHIDKTKEILKEIDEKLTNDQEFYVNMHPYVKNQITMNEYKNIKLFPKEYETYDFLNSCDVLITDYSSVFFDFAVTNRKIILFTYDLKEYITGRGMYLNIEDLPFKKVFTTDELFDELKNEVVPYPEFIEKFCKYDTKDNALDVIKTVFDNNTDKVEPFKTINDAVLLESNSFNNEDIFQEMKKIIDFDEKHYYLGFANNIIKKNKYRLEELKEKTYFFGYFQPYITASILDTIRLLILKKFPKYYNIRKNKIEKIYKEEYLRRYEYTSFKEVVLFDEKALNQIYLYAFSDICYKTIYFSKLKSKINYDILKKYDKIVVRTFEDKEILLKHNIDEEIIVVLE